MREKTLLKFWTFLLVILLASCLVEALKKTKRQFYLVSKLRNRFNSLSLEIETNKLECLSFVRFNILVCYL